MTPEMLATTPPERRGATETNDRPVIRDGAPATLEVVTPSILHTQGAALSRARMLDVIRFTFEEDAKAAVERTRAALTATRPPRRRVRTLPDGGVETTIDEGGTPDWPVQLDAAKMMFNLAGLSDRKHDADSDPSRPIAVNIVVQGQPASQSSDVAVRVALP